MNILPINQVNFKRAYTSKERMQVNKLREEALKILDCDKVIAIVPEISMPSEPNKNIGIGQLNSSSSDNFFEFLKTYAGANSIKILPSGEFVKHPNLNGDNFYCNYTTSAITLGTHSINLEELTSSEMGNVLSKETLDLLYKSAAGANARNMADFENVVGLSGMHNMALSEAYGNFKKSSAPEIISEKKLFEIYKKENPYIEKRALYECSQEIHGTLDTEKWPEIDKHLFNSDIVSEETRQARISELSEKYNEKIDFTYFKQYLADKNLSKARQNMHSKGLSLTGDCLIGFSADELWAYPKAFEQASVASKNWGLRALNYSEILEEGSESNKLFKLKVENFARRYDNIRFDVGWAYIDPILYPKNTDAKNSMAERYSYDSTLDGYRTKEPLGERLLNVIEETVKRVKGEDYKKENLFYEIEAGIKEFSPYDWENNKVIEPLKNRTIVQSTMYMDENYATIGQLEGKMHIPRENYIIMAGNHDHLALNSFARKIDTDGILREQGNNITEVFEKQIVPLSRDLKLDKKTIKESPEEFVKAKFAYNFLGKNIKMFFMDIWGRIEQFDSQKNNSAKNYRYRLGPNYEEEFHKAVQEGRGFNIMDSIAKAMKAKGLDRENKKLYQDILKYAEILSQKGVQTESAANKMFKQSGKNWFIYLTLTSAVGFVLGAAAYLLNKTPKEQEPKKL